MADKFKSLARKKNVHTLDDDFDLSENNTQKIVKHSFPIFHSFSFYFDRILLLISCFIFLFQDPDIKDENEDYIDGAGIFDTNVIITDKIEEEKQEDSGDGRGISIFLSLINCLRLLECITR